MRVAPVADFSTSARAATPDGRALLHWVGFGLSVVLALLVLMPPSLLRLAELHVFDAMLQARVVPPQSAALVLVGIDEASLAAYGQWPWPRYRLAMLVERLQGLGAQVVALDVLMPEPDRSAPERVLWERARDLGEAGASEPLTLTDSNSSRLATALHKGPTVLAYANLYAPGAAASASQPEAPAGVVLIDAARVAGGWPRATGSLRSIPVLTEAASAEGFANALHDPDGTLRRVPLLSADARGARFSLAMSAVVLATGARTLRLRKDGGDARLEWRGASIPLDANGNLLLDFRAPHAFPYLSAREVLSGQVAPGRLAGKIVLVGVWGKGLSDPHYTPLGGPVNGVEIHANVIDSMLSGRFIAQPGWSGLAECLLVLLLGGAMTSLVSRSSATWALGVTGAGSLALYAAARAVLVAKGLYLSPLLPVLTLVIVTSALGLVRYGLERRKVFVRTRQLFAAEESRRDAALHTRTILENLMDGVITANRRGVLESFNHAASAIFGYRPGEVLGRDYALLLPDTAGRSDRKWHPGGLLRRSVGQALELEGRHKDGRVFPISLRISAFVRHGKTTFVAVVRDMTQQRKDEEEIRRLAFFDPLTGLANRRLLLDRLRHAMLANARSGQHGALLFLDLDRFKLLNDTKGHGVGDELLQHVAQRLTACVREGDSVARLGGDEFVVLLEGLSAAPHEAATETKAIAAKILAALGQPYDLRGHAYDSTPSIGIMMFAGEEEAIDELFKKADLAMYQAKTAGRNTVRFFDPAMQAAVAAYTALEQDLRRSLGAGEFLLHYQIQVDRAGATLGAEALVRWQHPTQGLLPPARFIPLAEDTRLILPLGRWVMETACMRLVQWSRAPETAQWTMAINVSALQFAHPEFTTALRAALVKTGADPRRLQLELTESILVGEVEETIARMNEIKACGVGFALDDFGTGYSSLSYLKRLPLDWLKIDKSFVNEVLTQPSDAVIARTIVALGHSLGLKVLAEGVETTGQHDFLASVGCDAYQGFLFGRPIVEPAWAGDAPPAASPADTA